MTIKRRVSGSPITLLGQGEIIRARIMVSACTSLTILLGIGGGGPVVEGISTEPSTRMGDGSMISLVAITAYDA